MPNEEKKTKYILEIVFTCNVKSYNAELMADGRYVYREVFHEDDLGRFQDIVYFFSQKNCVRIEQNEKSHKVFYEYISMDKVEIIRIYEEKKEV